MDELTRNDLPAEAMQQNHADALPAEAVPPKPTLKRLFFGDDGLRAGWSVLLFLVLAALLSFAANTALRASHLVPLPVEPAAGAPAREMQARVSLLGEMSGFAAFALAALLMSVIERRPFRRYGLTALRSVSDAAAGLFWGLAALSVLVGVLRATHHLVFDRTMLHGQAAVVSGLKWAAVFFFVGLFEEFVTRGYLQYTVARGVAGIARAMNPQFRHTYEAGFWITALIFSVGFFMAAHLANPGETLPGILAVGAAGAVFAYSLWRTASLWWAIGFHTSWDWAQSFLYGVPDSGTLSAGRLEQTHAVGSTWLSGGPAGPEGSVLVLPTLLLVAVIIRYTLPLRERFLTPDQQPWILGQQSDVSDGQLSTNTLPADPRQEVIAPASTVPRGDAGEQGNR